MLVVGSAAGRQNLEIKIVCYTSQVSVKLLLQFSRDQGTAFFGDENAMQEIGSMYVRQERCRS